MKISNRKILIGISGGIAAYKSAYLVRLLIKAGAEVQVVMTQSATKFITPLTFEALTDREVPVVMHRHEVARRDGSRDAKPGAT